MEDNEYTGVYVIKILLADTAWSNSNFNNEIKSGKIEDILCKSQGVKSFWKGASDCQNVAVVINAENSFDLMKKLNELHYVRELTLLKDGLISGKGEYIPVGNYLRA